MGEKLAHSVLKVNVDVELSSDVAPLFGATTASLCAQIEHGVTEIFDALGIPGEPVARVITGKTAAKRPSRWLCVRVDGRVCRYSTDLLVRVHSYVADALPVPGASNDTLLQWLKETGAQAAQEFLCLACLEILKRQPAALLGQAQLAEYCHRLPDVRLTPDYLGPILGELLHLRLSIADTETVTRTVAGGLDAAWARSAVIEDLIDALSPSVVEILVPPDGFRQFTVGAGEQEAGLFALMRDGLFYELGLRYPDFRFVTVPSLKPGSFAFRVNHLTTLPWIGLPTGRFMVNDGLDGLRRRGIASLGAMVNPANCTPAGIIDADLLGAAKTSGLTAWSPLGYLVLCFSTVLRRHGKCFVNGNLVRSYLEQLQQDFPVLDFAVRQLQTDLLTRVLRLLAAEQVSIRNLRLIFESLLDFDYIRADDHAEIIFDDRLPLTRPPDKAWFDDPVNRVAFVRVRLKRYLSHKYTVGQDALEVNLLEPKLEEMLAAHQRGEISLDEQQRDRIIDAVIAEDRPDRAIPPALLTATSARAALREAVAMELPHVPLLAYQELSPDLNIRPLARILLNS